MKPLHRQALALAGVALAAFLKAHVAGDVPDDHEANTFGLPNGNPLAKELKRFFREQLQKTLGHVGRAGAEIPAQFLPLADYDDAMASAMTPLLSAYWSKAGRALAGRLNLDPAEWRVTDPNLHAAIQAQAFDFAASTNSTTDKELAVAHEQLRAELHAGLVESGEAIPQLVKRVKQVFERASTTRATAIARTEAARAVHAAALASAEASGVVAGSRWLVSANSCPRCQALGDKAAVALGGVYEITKAKEAYAVVKHPPLHPHCRCSLVFDLKAGGEPVPAWVHPDTAGEPTTTPAKPRRRPSKPAAPAPAEAVPAPTPDPEPVPKPEPVPEPEPTPAAVPPPAAVPATPAAGDPIPAAVAAARQAIAAAESGPIAAGPVADRIAAHAAGDVAARHAAAMQAHFAPQIAPLEEQLATYSGAINRLIDQKSRHEGDVGLYTRMLRPDRRDEAQREVDATVERIAAAKAAREQVGADLARLVAQRNAAIHDALAADTGHKVIASFGSEPLNDSTRRAIDQGNAFIERQFRRIDSARDLAIHFKDRGDRACYNHGHPSLMWGGEIGVSRNQATAANVVHELGHAIDHNDRSVWRLAQEFLAYRVGKEKATSMNAAGGPKFYGDDESGCLDDFAKAFGARAQYVGKKYALGGTEIVAMGLEKYYADPGHFAAADPEYFKLVHGIMSGAIR